MPITTGSFPKSLTAGKSLKSARSAKPKKPRKPSAKASTGSKRTKKTSPETTLDKLIKGKM